MFRLDLPASSSFSLAECHLIYNNGLQVYQLFPPQTSTIIVTPNGETIQPLSAPDCGARVFNVSESSPAFWTLQAQSSGGTTAVVSGTLRLYVLDAVPASRSTTESGIAGHFGTITCPGDYNQQRHCEIKDVGQGKVTESCEMVVKYPSVGVTNIYQCQVFFWGRLEAVFSEIHVSSYAHPPKVVSTTEHTTNHVLLTCAVSEESLSLCRAESLATGAQFLIMDGFQSRRYSAWNTQLQEGLCQFEIPTPLAANETGVWRIHGKLASGGQWTGCLFHVNADLQTVYQNFRLDFREFQEKNKIGQKS